MITTLQQFAGNERTLSAVQTMLQADRVPQTVMLEGPAGSGRKTLARLMAAGLLCEGETRPCGKCAVCRLVQTGHPDVMEIAPEKDKTAVSVDQIRRVRADAFVRPNQGRCKVYILCGAVRPEAQNAFLKLLEEPPKGVYFILLCQSAKGLLPTIISRCSMINLGGEAEINEEAQKAAEEIANGIISLSEYDLLLALRSLADKSLADDILRAVKLILFDAVTVLSGAKASYKPELAKKLSSRFTRKKLLDMIELTDSSKYKLKQNININLLTTQLCGEYRRISWQR